MVSISHPWSNATRLTVSLWKVSLWKVVGALDATAQMAPRLRDGGAIVSMPLIGEILVDYCVGDAVQRCPPHEERRLADVAQRCDQTCRSQSTPRFKRVGSPTEAVAMSMAFVVFALRIFGWAGERTGFR